MDRGKRLRYERDSNSLHQAYSHSSSSSSSRSPPPAPGHIIRRSQPCRLNRKQVAEAKMNDTTLFAMLRQKNLEKDRREDPEIVYEKVREKELPPSTTPPLPNPPVIQVCFNFVFMVHKMLNSCQSERPKLKKKYMALSCLQ